MPESITRKAGKVFEPLVICFMATSDTSCDLLPRFWICHCTRAFAVFGTVTHVTIIGFNTLTRLQHVNQSILEDCVIVPTILPWKVWTWNPYNRGIQEGNCNFIPVGSPFKLIGIKTFVSCTWLFTQCSKVSAINWNQTVISSIIPLSVFPQDLNKIRITRGMITADEEQEYHDQDKKKIKLTTSDSM